MDYESWIVFEDKKIGNFEMKMSFLSSLNFARFINQLTIYYTPYLWNSFVFIRLK